MFASVALNLAGHLLDSHDDEFCGLKRREVDEDVEYTADDVVLRRRQ
jgi:hypothetical protein